MIGALRGYRRLWRIMRTRTIIFFVPGFFCIITAARPLVTACHLLYSDAGWKDEQRNGDKGTG